MSSILKEIESLLNRDANEEALVLIERALEREPENRSLYVLRGRGRLALLNLALEHDSLSETEKENRYAAIKTDFANGFTGNPRDIANAYRGMMMLNLTMGRAEECIALCEKYREEFRSQDCNYFWASALINCFERDGNPEHLKKAEKLLREGRMPGRPGRVIRMTLARVLMMQQRYEEGLAIVKKILWDKALLPSHYMLMVEGYMNLDRPDRALPYIQYLAKLWPDDPGFRAVRADVALAAGQDAQASADAEYCLSRQPSVQMTMIAVRAACQTNSEPEEILKQLERLRAVRPEKPDYAFLELESNLLCDLDRKEEALALLQEAEPWMEEGEKNLCRAQIARVLASLERYDEALALVNELLASHPSAVLEYYQGMILYDGAKCRADMEKARESLLKAIRNGIDSPLALLRLISASKFLRDYPFLNNLLRKGRLPKWAQNYLAGVLSQEVHHDYAGAVLHFSKAARAGLDCASEMITAQMHIYSNRGTAPLQSAVRELAQREPYWKRTLAEGLAYGLFGLRPTEEKRRTAFRLCEELTAEVPRYSCGFSLLGQLYLQGWGVEKDAAKAVTLFEKAKELDEAGFPVCHCQDGFLAACLERGEGIGQDSARAQKIILEAVERSGKYVHDNVGALYTFYFLRGEPGFQAETVRALCEQALIEHNFNPALFTIFLRAADKAGLNPKKIDKRLKQCRVMGAKVLNDQVAAHGSDPEYFPAMCN